MQDKQESTAVLVLDNFYVCYIEETEMWGVYSGFLMPNVTVSEWYTKEEAIAAAKQEEALWQAKRQ